MDLDNVAHRDEREFEAKRLTRFRIDAHRSGRALAATQDIGTDHKVAIRVESFTRPDEEAEILGRDLDIDLPPAGCQTVPPARRSRK